MTEKPEEISKHSISHFPLNKTQRSMCWSVRDNYLKMCPHLQDRNSEMCLKLLEDFEKVCPKTWVNAMPLFHLLNR